MGAQSLDGVDMLRSTTRVVYRPGTIAADMCPRCKGDNAEDWSLCAACAPA
ncbi:hypothetical protein [Streptomyces sp. NPDC056682]|uniref:hypothetical protein n=1 Tax=Streptomyces sp. NPDC056682 TaxID=3345909 RepID=UPI003673DA78